MDSSETFKAGNGQRPIKPLVVSIELLANLIESTEYAASRRVLPFTYRPIVIRPQSCSFGWCCKPPIMSEARSR
jgi:hypothetical protein